MNDYIVNAFSGFGIKEDFYSQTNSALIRAENELSKDLPDKPLNSHQE